jgi:hypothetical protein
MIGDQGWVFERLKDNRLPTINGVRTGVKATDRANTTSQQI